jgi:hypothetical protein
VKFDPKRIEWLTVLIGIGMLSIFGQFSYLELNFYVESTVTPGEVVKLNHGGYHPQVAFTTVTGERITFPGSTTYPVEVGDRLDVRYTSADPHAGVRVDQRSNLIWDIAPLMLALAVIVAGLLGKSVLPNGKK